MRLGDATVRSAENAAADELFTTTWTVEVYCRFAADAANSAIVPLSTVSSVEVSREAERSAPQRYVRKAAEEPHQIIFERDKELR